MNRFASPVHIVAGLRTPFGRGGRPLAAHDAISLGVPVAKAMAAKARPDLFVWGTVLPSLGWSNIARDVWLDAGLDTTVPAFSVVLACSTSMVAAITAAGMLGGGIDLVMVGGSEVMSQPPVGLTVEASKRLVALFRKDPAQAFAALQALDPTKDMVLPLFGFVNRITGRSMGDHMEETAKIWEIARTDQDAWALESHKRSVAGWEKGFFDDLVISVPELVRDANPRSDTSLEKLASLPVVFDKTSGRGTLTAGNSSPITDGAAACWVANQVGLDRLPAGSMHAELVDFEIAAVDYDRDGLLMAPSVAIPRLLARHGLRYEDVALWEIHEAFAAQVLANVAALEKPDWIAERTGITSDFGPFPWESVNPNGGSVAIGHPFAATGARDMSQAVKELWSMPAGSLAIVSVCADGGHGTVALLRKN